MVDAKNDAPVNTTPDKQSTKPVAGVSAVTKDDPKEGVKTNNEKAAEKAAAEQSADNTTTPESLAISKEEEAKLESILNGVDTEHPPENAGRMNDNGSIARAVPDWVGKLRKLAQAIPADTSDDHILWGAAGVSLTVGDLRSMVKHLY